jgi:hypothetical protein
MKRIQLSIVMLGAGCFAFATSRIESYLNEAQKAIQRPIRVVEMPMPENSTDIGLTTWDHAPDILIRIRGGLPDHLWDDVMAHELGHILLRARGFHGGLEGLTQAALGRNQPFMKAAADLASNCYEDPLADAEATKHGFHPERISDYIANGVEQYVTMFDINAREKEDALWPNYQGLYQYCLELRSHTFNESEFEQKFAIEPRIRKLQKKLTKELGVSKCKTPKECFEKSKRLRDAAGFGGLITLGDPKTGKQE